MLPRARGVGEYVVFVITNVVKQIFKVSVTFFECHSVCNQKRSNSYLT